MEENAREVMKMGVRKNYHLTPVVLHAVELIKNMRLPLVTIHGNEENKIYSTAPSELPYSASNGNNILHSLYL